MHKNGEQLVSKILSKKARKKRPVKGAKIFQKKKKKEINNMVLNNTKIFLNMKTKIGSVLEIRFAIKGCF